MKSTIIALLVLAGLSVMFAERLPYWLTRAVFEFSRALF